MSERMKNPQATCGRPATWAARKRFRVRYFAVLIAAITSVAPISNPSVLVAAGIAAQCLRAQTQLPTVGEDALAPGSRVVPD